MLTNLRGRVESDPMGVPAPATMAGRGGTFDSLLQQVVDAQQPTAVEPVPAPTEPAQAPAEPPPVEDQAAENPPEDQPEAVAEAATPAATDPLATSQAAPAADATSTVRRGEPERQETAGKGAASPRPSSRTAEPLLAAVIQRAAPDHGAPTAIGPAPTAPAAGAIQGTGPVRGAAGTPIQTATPTRAAAVAGGYRTSAATSAELLENARDSVFKQILMKLTGDGGEMRMRLEPPDLGELDLHLLVEGGNKLSLSISAERADVSQLLQRHLDELKQTLQAAGLEITDAQVRTRDEQGASTRGDRRSDGRAEAEMDSRNTKETPRLPRGGYVTAEGLDFWV